MKGLMSSKELMLTKAANQVNVWFAIIKYSSQNYVMVVMI